MKIRFLGTGTSHGIPVIGCKCAVCTSGNSKNKRFRSSILVQQGKTNIVIDTGPEFRLQAIAADLAHLNAVLLTHSHADHLHGIDDIRPFSREAPLMFYGARNHLREVRRRFDYIFRTTQLGGGKPKIHLRPLGKNQKIQIDDISIQVIPIKHGKLDIYGYRIGDFSYLTDCSFISEQSFKLLEGTKILTVGAVMYKPHQTHFSVAQALDAAQKIGAQKAYITHISHKLEHEKLLSELPAWAKPAWDGLVLDIPSR